MRGDLGLGTGTWNWDLGLGLETWNWDLGLGTWDSRGGTRRRGDVWDVGTSKLGDTGGNVGGKCDVSFFVKMCYLWSTLDSIVQNHIGHLMMLTQNISLYRNKRTVSKHLLLDLPLKICQTN